MYTFVLDVETVTGLILLFCKLTRCIELNLLMFF